MRWLKYWYPAHNLDIVTASHVEHKSGFVLILSILCGLLTIYYIFCLDSQLSSWNLALIVYFFAIPFGMKWFGRWNVFGIAMSVGWGIENLYVSYCSPIEAIPLSFFQSLIPSYFIIVSEEYVLGGFVSSILLMYSLPFEYSVVSQHIESLSDNELRAFINSTVQRTKILNSGHLLLSFCITIWMHACSRNKFKIMSKLLEETKQAKQAAEMFFAAFSHEFRNPLAS